MRQIVERETEPQRRETRRDEEHQHELQQVPGQRRSYSHRDDQHPDESQFATLRPRAAGELGDIEHHVVEVDRHPPHWPLPAGPAAGVVVGVPLVVVREAMVLHVYEAERPETRERGEEHRRDPSDPEVDRWNAGQGVVACVVHHREQEIGGDCVDEDREQPRPGAAQGQSTRPRPNGKGHDEEGECRNRQTGHRLFRVRNACDAHGPWGRL